METSQVVVHGSIDPDGILQVHEPIPLPPGEVQVTIQVIEPISRPRNSIWDVMERIWADHRTSGFIPRSRAEIDAEHNTYRENLEEGFLKVEEIQKECETFRHVPKTEPEQGS
ncbi:MAG: hypothetical protein IT426_10405 [Pirellulales bacterium]|nr:hypothetical protein [Pirellulales bacterium]